MIDLKIGSLVIAKELQSTLDIVTLDLREIRYKGQIFIDESVCSYGWYNVKSCQSRQIRYKSKNSDVKISLLYLE